MFHLSCQLIDTNIYNKKETISKSENENQNTLCHYIINMI